MYVCAGDADLSRAVKGGLLYKEILDHSEPLLRIVEHISSAKVSIDLCLYMLTQHKLGEAVVRRLKESNIRVRFIVNESTSKARWKFFKYFKYFFKKITYTFSRPQSQISV